MESSAHQPQHGGVERVISTKIGLESGKGGTGVPGYLESQVAQQNKRNTDTHDAAACAATEINSAGRGQTYRPLHLSR